ncbi:hypothetical protein [Evansella tamaricis]|uniref:Uncharacterized protein n=1 Tax=Evansella tamaricis TaxID=2069301 RepID=A0ABS6J921_9BACI|nr:hypothetical protein [Evansella tamaricis]MBU9710187.1 hypothetical protein [Evansella tamaricis]
MKRLLIVIVGSVTFCLMSACSISIEEFVGKDVDVKSTETASEEKGVSEENHEDNLPTVSVLDMREEELLKIASSIYHEVDLIYLAKTEEEYDQLVESTFIDTEYYGERLLEFFEVGGRYMSIETTLYDEQIQIIDESSFEYILKYEMIAITEDGQVDLYDHGNFIQINFQMDEGGEFKISEIP